MQTARLLVLTLLLVLLIVAPAQAQSELLIAMPGEVGAEINSTTNYVSPVAPPVSLPDTPSAQRVKVKVIDKKFIAVMAALAGTESLRFTAHKLVLDHEYAAGAPWVTSVPSNQHMVAKYAGIYAAELLMAYQLKKPHPWLPGDKVIRKLWWVYPVAMMVIHTKNGVGSIRTQPPSGCPVADCQPQ